MSDPDLALSLQAVIAQWRAQGQRLNGKAKHAQTSGWETLRCTHEAAVFFDCADEVEALLAASVRGEGREQKELEDTRVDSTK